MPVSPRRALLLNAKRSLVFLALMQLLLARNVRSDPLEAWERFECDVNWVSHTSERGEEKTRRPFVVAGVDDDAF